MSKAIRIHANGGPEVLAYENADPGQPVIISPSLSDEQAKQRFPQGWKQLRPYLRVVQLQDRPRS